MGKRRSLNPALRWLDEVLDEEEFHGDVLEISLIQDFIAKLQPLAREFDDLLRFYRKKMGRHARPEERDKQHKDDLEIFRRVEQLRKVVKSLDDAFATWGEHEEETVKKAYYRAKKRLSSNHSKTRSRKRT